MARTTLFLLLFFAPSVFAWTFAIDGQTRNVTLDKNGWPQTLAVRRGLPRKADRYFPLDGVHLKNQKGLALWTVTNQWDWSWETRFSEWVKGELNAGWWKAHGIATDCADVVYSARWIFARNNGLPMANHLITGQIFSHESVKPEWEALPTDPDWRRDQRFLAALDFLLSQAFTHSLWKDSYPVAVNASSILPGGYHLYIHDDTGHTQFIYKVGRRPADLPLVTLNSTVPREMRDLMEWAFFEPGADPRSRALVRMRWPVFENGAVKFVEPARMPYFSNEQFSPYFVGADRGTYWREVYYRLNPNADFDLIAQKTVQQIVDQFRARVPVVTNGHRECSLSPCRKGTARYDAWSTPSRDRRIGDTIAIFDSLSSMINSWSDVSRLMRQTVLDVNGRAYSGADFMSVWRAETYSSDPNDPVNDRWGL